MKRGRPGVPLSSRDVARLKKFRVDYGDRLRTHLGLPEFRRVINAPFSWETLQRALAGKAIHPDSHDWILQLLDRVTSEATPAAKRRVDFKSRASGERESDENSNTNP